MSDNIRTAIIEIMNDKRLSRETKKLAARLNKIIGTTKKIPDDLKKAILALPSDSDSTKRMKNYVKNKK